MSRSADSASLAAPAARAASCVTSATTTCACPTCDSSCASSAASCPMRDAELARRVAAARGLRPHLVAHEGELPALGLAEARALEARVERDEPEPLEGVEHPREALPAAPPRASRGTGVRSATPSIAARCRAAVEAMRCAAAPASRARTSARSWALQRALSSAVERSPAGARAFAVRAAGDEAGVASGGRRSCRKIIAAFGSSRRAKTRRLNPPAVASPRRREDR